MSELIYLDYAAATPVDERVLEAMQPYFAREFFNPSATYLAAGTVRKDLEAARSKVALILGARPAEIIFTAGATEANNLALFGTLEKYPDGEIVSTAIEHESVLAPLHELQKRGHKVTLVRPDAKGQVDPQKIAAAITDKTVLVSVMYANNEVGTVQPIKEIAQAIREKRAQRSGLPLLLHTDAAQAGNYLDLHVARLGVDLMSINGGKIYGPKQSGALYVASHVQLRPLIFGGGQERGLRNGTENVPACIGLAEALEIAQNTRREEAERLSKIQREFISLLKTKIPTMVVNGSLKKRLPNNIHITIPGQDNERLIMELDGRGIMAAAGSACSASNEEPSHVLKVMGISEKDAQSSVRFSMGRQTTFEDIQKVVEVLSGLV